MRERLRQLFTPGSIRGDASRIYALQFATVGLALATSIVVARSLGPTQKGVVDLFNLLNAFINDLGALGFGTGLLYYLMARRWPIGALHGAGVGFAALAGGITAIAGWLGLPLLKDAFPGLPAWAILLACALAPVTCYRLIWGNLMTGLGRAVMLYRVGLWSAAALAAILGLLWATKHLTPTSIIIAIAVLSPILAVASFRILRREGRIQTPSAALLRSSLTYGLVTYVSAAANTLHFKIDQVMLNSMMGTGAVGVYAVGVRWAETVFLLDGAIFAAAMHRIGAGADAQSYALTKRLFSTQLLISGGAAVLVAAFSHLLIVGAYGSAYRGAILPMILLMPGVVSWSAGKLLSQYLVLRRGKTVLALMFSVAGLAANLALNWVLIPRAGLAGAAVSSSVSYILVIVLTVVAFRYFGRHAAESSDAADVTVAVDPDVVLTKA